MKRWVIAVYLALGVASPGLAAAWGAEGHSIVAEIAQHRLTSAAGLAIERLLGHGTSLASISSWADNVRDARPDTYNWHFVDIPIAENAFDEKRDCASSPRGDCVVAELRRLKSDLRCATSDSQKKDALRFAVHFVGDIHQPFHTVAEQVGGNKIVVATYIAGAVCQKNCSPPAIVTNLHAVWDSTIIQRASFDWGALEEQIEQTMPSGTATAGSTEPSNWAEETHQIAQQVWKQNPANGVVDESYYSMALPIVKNRLGIAGVRLAVLLNDAYSSSACPVN